MLSFLWLLALHVGLQEGNAHESFVTEVALGREKGQKKHLGHRKRLPHVPGMAKLCCYIRRGGDLKISSYCAGGIQVSGVSSGRSLTGRP